jgi:glycosyltransferase involved in cell wall biosynthesis
MANLRARPSNWLQVPSLLVSFLATTWRVVREERPDVIHAHWIVPAGLVARILRPLTGVPYVVTVHGADAYTLRTRAARALKRSVVRGALSTVPVSEAIGQELGSLGRVSAAVPMGVDVTGIRARVGVRRTEHGRVLFVGRLVEKKGVDVLLDAVARVPDIKVIVAGGGPLLDQLLAQSEALGLSDRAEFLGHCTRDQVLEQLSRAQLVVLPSQVGAGGDQDGAPIVLGEAMAAGVPVVASRLGGLAEHIADQDTGRLVTPGSVEELAAALQDLVADHESAERLARAAGAYVERVLDVDAVGDRYLDIFASSGLRTPGRTTR